MGFEKSPGKSTKTFCNANGPPVDVPIATKSIPPDLELLTGEILFVTAVFVLVAAGAAVIFCRELFFLSKRSNTLAK